MKQETIKEINGWVANKTNEKIKDLLSNNDVSESTKLILVNAIYFKGNWAKKFDPSLTDEQDFHVNATETVKVQLMKMSAAKVWYGVNDELKCKALALPYVDEALTLFIILPDHHVTDIHAVEHSLTADHVSSNIFRSFDMRKSKVEVFIPRFKLDEKMQLESILAKMGIFDLFQNGKADLTGISGSRELHVSKVVHRAFVEVNEEGSEAAAATAVIMTFGCCMNTVPQEPCVFRADHPFLFFICDNATGSVLFLGRLTKP